MLYLQFFQRNISKPAFCRHSERIFFILRTAVQQKRTFYIVTGCLSQGDGDIRKNLFWPLFDCICPWLGQISGKEISGPRAYIILPSDKDLPAASASSDCCHFGVINCVMHLQISAFKTEKWTRKRASTSDEFLCAIVMISLIPSYPASALVGIKDERLWLPNTAFGVISDFK